MEEYLIAPTSDIKMVADYTRLNFEEVLALDCITFKMLVRDAFIHMMSKTEEGRKYLEDCWVLKQTKPERDKLRKQFKEGIANA